MRSYALPSNKLSVDAVMKDGEPVVYIHSPASMSRPTHGAKVTMLNALRADPDVGRKLVDSAIMEGCAEKARINFSLELKLDPALTRPELDVLVRRTIPDILEKVKTYPAEAPKKAGSPLAPRTIRRPHLGTTVPAT